MNKNHWISVLLDGSVDGGTVRWLTKMSFELTDKKIRIKGKMN
jgi:predicted DNA-binding protein (MmcQ/YjbR family)